jgi:hypothetical protein
MARIDGFTEEVRSLVKDSLRIADAWSGLKAEYDAFVTNLGATPVKQDVLNGVFGLDKQGLPVVTEAQFIAGITAQQALVDALHVPATAAKLYRLK